MFRRFVSHGSYPVVPLPQLPISVCLLRWTPVSHFCFASGDFRLLEETHDVASAQEMKGRAPDQKRLGIGY